MSEKCANIWFEPLYIHSFMEFHQKKYTGLFYNIYLTYLPAKVCEKAKKCIQKVEIDGIFPNRQEETPKEKRLMFGLELGHFHLCYRGDKYGNPLKVNISWFMTLFWEFYGSYNCSVLTYNVEAAAEEMGTAYLIILKGNLHNLSSLNI